MRTTLLIISVISAVFMLSINYDVNTPIAVIWGAVCATSSILCGYAYHKIGSKRR